MYCQLYDLPAGGNKKGRLRDPRYTLLSVPHFVNRGTPDHRSFRPATSRISAIHNEGKEKSITFGRYLQGLDPRQAPVSITSPTYIAAQGNFQVATG
jgi:hypothetical protein